MNKEIIETLDKILPVVERVHSDHHPELHKVAELYTKLKAEPSRKIFDELQEVTGKYAIPEDACPTYAKTYNLLEELDKEFV